MAIRLYALALPSWEIVPKDHIQVIQILWTRADPLAASYVHPLFPAQVACPRGVAHAEHARWSGSFSL